MSRVWAGVCMNQMMKTAHSACGHPFIIFSNGYGLPTIHGTSATSAELDHACVTLHDDVTCV
jgi:hypothetical protein